jgi:hypothetical protein
MYGLTEVVYLLPMGSSSAWKIIGRWKRIWNLIRHTKGIYFFEEKEPIELSYFTEVVFSVYESSFRSCVSVRWKARDPLLPGSSLAGGREYKIVSLSEEKEAT